ncbi:sporulation protein YabP [Phocea massiliensis]|uniref:Sporulation protein YabP n=1 Tax=Merdimmobilis hominis TaxID=2897707 RepID=A0A939BEG3_9FIRM|nr:sporulation protein YabP [Merdimmobilis hominis]
MQGEMTKQAPHHVVLENRKKLSVSGVNDIESFDESHVLLHTVQGCMDVRGSRLHIGVLDVETGNLSIDGMVEAIIYRDEEKRKQRMSIWARIFR